MDINKVLSFAEENIEQPLWGNWYIKEKIGSGAFSSVYRIEAKRTSRTDAAALKVEPITAGESLILNEERRLQSIEEKRAFVENESTIMYKLRNCPYVVAYEDEDLRRLVVNGRFEGYFFLIRMELLQCVTDLIYERKFELSESNILKLAMHIGKAIKAAHDINVIHRDIKPSNFFLSQWGTYKLGDFNVSKQSDSARTFAGTDGYQAPEIFLAKADVNERYTMQADIYSFGICLYQFMNNLYFPFEEECSKDEAISRRMDGESLKKPINATEDFGAIILKACAFNSADRYSTMDEMLTDLKKLEKLPSVTATVSSAKEFFDDNRTVYADDIFEAGNEPNGADKTDKASVNSKTKFVKLSAGWKHTAALREDGTVVAVGDNKYGQCSVGDWQNIIDVFAGYNFTVGLKNDGTVLCTLKERGTENWRDIIAVAVGERHIAGLKNNGAVIAVGDNSSGQCEIEGWTDITAISAGADHTVGLTKNGKVVAVGYNRNGECGVYGWGNITAVSARAYYTVGLRSDGRVVSVGLNPAVQSEIRQWNEIVQISAGVRHTVGLRSDGTVVAVGDNSHSECEVSDWKDIIAVSAGSWHTVGLKSDGTLVAVGNNKNGQCNCNGL